MIWIIVIALIIGVLFGYFRYQNQKQTIKSEIKGELYDGVCEKCGTMLKVSDTHCPNCLTKRK